ncbi:DUF72 domain-containing protein [Aeromicrobium duanguangcaii]|uniref:DUF72 domain-containing protein n=1 Tax=Aeromicrobium duanguangcaii TaxID=2968086 RepID=A0ABY5KF61_9ACTN|nr:DUF72 domain-containing protein [Aeromicrobium duanguangcaii]MCD9154825.1 DUF72 domain-containing protein [Aeromicrobium duanguangcaii]UUI67762.1 DUF72 domain-containing protein [Aeromicrobium duanguangcaii]
MADARYLIGVSGWSYASWRGDFYPKGLVQRRELEHVASRLTAVEVNGTFYSLQRPTTFARWAEQTPPGFSFALKGSRYVTHLLKLVNVETALANFFASGVLELGERLGPIVWQLPATSAYDPDVLGRFLALLPRTMAEAARLAERHDDRLGPDRAVTQTRVDGPIRHALEVRHPSFTSPDYAAVLRDLGVAGVWTDAPKPWPVLDLPSSSIAYARLHGHTRLYASRYSDRSLDEWAAWCRRRHDEGLDVHVYFDNDSEGHAPHDAERLLQRLR